MNDLEIHEIRKIEHHLLMTCPCRDCEEERSRREHSNHPLHSMSVENAHTLGFLTSRCPEGSLARQIADQETPIGALRSLSEGQLANRV
jgi:hypothetical protein